MNKNIKNSLVKIIFIVSVLILWQVLYTLKIWPDILFPSLGDIGKAFVTAFTERELGTMVLHSLSLIIKGLIVGIALALVFSSLSVISETFYTIYSFFGQHEPQIMPVSYELTQKWQAWLRMGCLASEMESAALFIAGSFLHVRVGACFLVLANQEREKRGLPNVQVHDTTQAIATTVDAIRLLIQEDKDADRL